MGIIAVGLADQAPLAYVVMSLSRAYAASAIYHRPISVAISHTCVAILPERRGFPPELGEYPTAEQNYHFGKLRVMEAGIGAPT